MRSKFFLNGIEFSCKHDDKTKLELAVRRVGDIDFYDLSCDFGEPRMPEKISIKWRAEARDVYSKWNPAQYDRHITFHDNDDFRSRLACWAPIMQTVSKSGKNRAAIAVEDVKIPISCNMHIDIYTEKVEFELVLFNDITNPMSKYSTSIRIDERDVPFEDALMDITDWYASLRPTCDPVPEKAYSPMYSTWYSYLQDISADSLIKECTEAKKYGMDAVILDDGWQTDDSTVLYGYTGDWQPTEKKFPNMRGTVDKLHEIGMDVIVWFSVPFIGHFSKNYERFKDMYLYSVEAWHAAILDPRYKEVRDFLIETYVNAMTEWNLDGLKLDFIDNFRSNGEIKPGMDFTSVEDATERLLLDVAAALKAIKPDVMIEFRQPYIGPVITECGNMLRVWDCPLDPMYNRIGSLNLRLTTKNCAVHADMINWVV